MSVIDTSELGELLRHLDSWVCLRVERRTDRVTLRVHDVVVGTLNLQSCGLLVNVPPGMMGPLLEGHPQLRGTRDSVSVRVNDADSRAAAEALLRWRVEIERYAPQLRAASP
jgi:hypothetical protein